MATWSIYLEVNGYPLYAEKELPDDYDENIAWEDILGDISMTLEVTKED